MKITFFPGNTQHVFNPRVILAEYLHVSSDVMTHSDVHIKETVIFPVNCELFSNLLL